MACESRHCTCPDSSHSTESGRRTALKAGLRLALAGAVSTAALSVPSVSRAAALTQKQRDSLTPDQIIESMKKGNERFRSGNAHQHDYLAQKRASAGGQFPAAVILSCIDSRTPAELILDSGIGDTFNARIAGNIANEDLAGSLEFACAAAGAKVVLVMGHTDCGAIKGAIDNVQLGNLTGLLAKIKPAIDATQYEGKRTGSNVEFVDKVARTNVQNTINDLRKRSEILASMERDGKIKMVGAMYHLTNGKVDFMT
ncbi:carbonic anhydrase [Burkholderia sp. SG-MS1]|uniref:carbonic anhydrase family protein n=1 Tax=Paraburkholderia sp. SG-MS1 TaxID=2023741 RepID=UPI001447BC4A|nr:carbonic anhydrase family protein [Paraburkholderia sp. SG-MS1]NKJ50856.1 carbonic anhydrase [Paraburkholderia sp. SG-MS1]